MAKSFLTDIVIGGKISPSLHTAFSKASKLASKTATTMSKVGGGMGKVAGGLSKVAGGVATVAGTAVKAGAVLGGAALAGGAAALNQAKHMEQYRNTLNVVMKDQEKAAKTFNWAVKFANKTPFETGDIVDATVKLQSYGIEAQKMLPKIGDMASAMGKPMDQAVEAIADAQTGELERLKEFGITKQMIVEQAAKKMKDIEVVNNKGQIVNQEAFNKTLLSLMDERYAGAMDIQSKSMSGLMSTISGIAKQGLAEIAGIDLFGNIKEGSLADKAKGMLGKAAETMLQLQESGAFSKAGDFLAGIADKGMATFQDMLPKIVGVAEQIAPVLMQVFDTLSQVNIGGFLLDIVSQLMPLIQQLVPFVLQLVPPLMQIVMALLPPLVSLFTSLLPVIMQLIPPLLQIAQAIIPYLGTVIQLLLSVLAPFLPILVELVINLVPILVQLLTAATSIISALIPVISFLANVIATVLSAAISFVMPIIQGLISLFSNIMLSLSDIISFVVNVFSGNWSAAWQNIVSVFGRVFGGIVGVARGPINAVIGLINKAIGAVNKIKVDIPSWVPKYGGQTFGFSIPKIPMFAKGGIATGPSIFGEAGPEMAIPLKKTPRSISLLKRTADMLGVGGEEGGKSVAITYAPQISGTSEREVMEALGLSFEEFKAWAEEFFREKRRLSFE